MRVIIYRSRLLETSETFIADHYHSLSALGVDCVFACDEQTLGNLGNFRIISNRTSSKGKFSRLLRKTIFNLLPNRSRLARNIREMAPDIIHAHFAPDAAEILPIARRLGIPLIVTLHGFDITANRFYYIKKLPFKWPYVLRHKGLKDYAAMVLPVSEYLRDIAIARGYSPLKTSTHYLGTTIPSAYTPFLPSQGRDILFVGRLVEKKGCHYLIDAYRRLISRHNVGNLVIIGEGPQRKALEENAVDLTHRIIFLGAQSRDVVRHHMTSTRVFCMPSMPAASGDNEGFGMVYIEAQLAGARTVAFDQGPVREALSPHNRIFLAEAGNINCLADKIAIALDSENHDAAGAAQYVVQNFDLMKQSTILIERYESAIRHATGDFSS